ncbi:putative periplasmic protein [Marinobacterium lacunae]|uniref:Putative periplasmic protein n=1 Tax=Marinobacterium lacunae TaxID=1232683 RepID=A0A081FTB1_9GAMM|nr:chalcone isomerase family protein [Marinobacterium lacunae]KEA61766.1 putative periplasmic protein [Marinobacterium lacunae]
MKVVARLVTLLLTLGATPLLANTEYRLVGEARLSVLFWDIYDAALYTGDGRYRGISAPMLLKLHYLRAIERDDLIDATRDELQQVAPELPADQSDLHLKQLSRIWPSEIAPGDSLSFELTATGGTFRFNEQPIGHIDDTRFAKAFIAIWLADDSSYPHLSRRLRGES